MCHAKIGMKVGTTDIRVDQSHSVSGLSQMNGHASSRFPELFCAIEDVKIEIFQSLITKIQMSLSSALTLIFILVIIDGRREFKANPVIPSFILIS
jgi:hypothetical protein